MRSPRLGSSRFQRQARWLCRWNIITDCAFSRCWITRAKRSFIRICAGFLSRAKQTLSYDRAYILYQGLEGRIAYLADADYAKDLQAGVDYHAIGEEYTDERYTRRCISILQEQFEGRRKETYVPDILDESYIIAYLPLRNADGEVMAVLGVDAKLGYSDFAQYGPINFGTADQHQRAAVFAQPGAVCAVHGQRTQRGRKKKIAGAAATVAAKADQKGQYRGGYAGRHRPE